MNWLDKEIWQEVGHTLRSNKKRTIVTAFGIFWGIFMLVVLLSVGSGVENGVHREIRGVATNTGFIATAPTSKAYHGFQKGRAWHLTLGDLREMKRKFPLIEKISPMAWEYQSFGDSGPNNVVYGKKSVKNDIFAHLPEYFDMVRQNVLAGRLLSEVDEMEKRSVCLISKKTATTLFEDYHEAIGKRIRINGNYYSVVGVIEPISKKMDIGGSRSSTIHIPYKLLQERQGQADRVDAFILMVQEGSAVPPVLKQVSQMLKSRYDIDPEDTGAIESMDVSSIFSLFSVMILSINLLVWIVGIGTLISGIVGISNIMLVTIRERTREIGVRRAIGATPKDIVRQILLESLSITLLAGFLGLMLGTLLMGVVSTIVDNNSESLNVPLVSPIISFDIALWASAIIAISGMTAGILPAIRAIKIKAIDAIRDE